MLAPAGGVAPDAGLAAAEDPFDMAVGAVFAEDVPAGVLGQDARASTQKAAGATTISTRGRGFMRIPVSCWSCPAGGFQGSRLARKSALMALTGIEDFSL
jgi:hypothetical protein